ncbi:MAG: Hsp20/alpha crystallin family protein [Alphaproteobacteria bacterium]|nr:Hsp20/alpha crystallin family protein [Alphaproteobacteria bacterium]
MEIKKFAPWNWIKDEKVEEGKTVPIQRNGEPKNQPQYYANPIAQIHEEMEKLFDNVFRGSGSLRFDNELSKTTQNILKPRSDISVGDHDYMIKLEIPGVGEDNVQIEISDNMLTVKGEKKLENEEKRRDFYRIERSYGSFQRVFSLPEDADQSNIKASFKNGILSISLPRKIIKKEEPKKILISKG